MPIFYMAIYLKKTDAGNLFVVFGKPDIGIHDAPDDQISVEIRRVDAFDPAKGEVRSDDADGIACWFIDTDYDEESFFVCHAYFLGVAMSRLQRRAPRVTGSTPRR